MNYFKTNSFRIIASVTGLLMFAFTLQAQKQVTKNQSWKALLLFIGHLHYS